jgi:hypothetical protein
LVFRATQRPPRLRLRWLHRHRPHTRPQHDLTDLTTTPTVLTTLTRPAPRYAMLEEILGTLSGHPSPLSVRIVIIYPLLPAGSLVTARDCPRHPHAAHAQTRCGLDQFTINGKSLCCPDGCSKFMLNIGSNSLCSCGGGCVYAEDAAENGCCRSSDFVCMSAALSSLHHGLRCPSSCESKEVSTTGGAVFCDCSGCESRAEGSQSEIGH